MTGPMARTAEDVALMLQAIAGPSSWSPLQQPIEGRDFVAAVRAGIFRGSRVAYCSDPARIGIEGAIERVCREAVRGLTAEGIVVDEIDLDMSPARQAFLALRGQWFATQMLPHMEHSSRFGTNVGNNVRSGLATTMADLAAAERERNRIWLRFRELFERYETVLAPCMAVSPFPVEQNYPDSIAGRPMQTYIDWIAPTFVFSLTGLPVASVPCGLDAAGLPVGLQIVGRPADEESVLALAAVVQRAHPLGSPRFGQS